jgi:hypothetical protein
VAASTAIIPLIRVFPLPVSRSHPVGAGHERIYLGSREEEPRAEQRKQPQVPLLLLLSLLISPISSPVFFLRRVPAVVNLSPWRVNPVREEGEGEGRHQEEEERRRILGPVVPS